LKKKRITNLAQAPPRTALKIVDISGGQGVRWRLLTLGFHKNDLVELDRQSIFRGPVLVKNLMSGTSVALGRGVAQKIIVEVIDEKK